ncbi:hypothetical protein [Algoriphagus hitonicola]|uniref:Outer membrane protein beta-barrel domain-containing protein n=1 Tax=Algoriphagus hitonicola TaxID=435880 RepID=A0A1I2NZ11_9BACT|nr:hypothetical protein [Algoriphagus hitonicola]SFG06531.1 hypothetical protein SAMN04487988_101275 [Algoriphagus hitonicola]
MKTVYLTLTFLICISTILTGNAQNFDQSTKVFSAGIGIGSSLGGFDYSSQIPAISLMYEQGVAEAGEVGIISIGGYVGYKSFSYETNSGTIQSKSKWNYTIIGVRGALHFTQIQNEKLDLYAGLMASYNLLNYSYEDNSGFDTGNSGNFGNTAGLTIFGGARYYFNPNLAVFGELGYGVAFLNVGLAVKL